MKSVWSIVMIVLILVTLMIPFSGCGGGKPTASPQQKEEQRQKLIKNAERERREG